MRIPGVNRAIGHLAKWSEKDEWASRQEQVFAQHFDTICDRFEMSEEEIADLLGDAAGMVFSFVLEAFLTARFDDDGKNVIDDYLRRRGWREKVSARRYLEALRDSKLSIYEVVDLEPGHSLTVRDLVLGGEPITVEEKLGSESAVRWDRIAGRIVTANNKVCFTGALLLLPQDVANEVLSVIDKTVKRARKDLRKEAKKQGIQLDLTDRDLRETIVCNSPQLLTQVWLANALERSLAPLPELRNSDGDEVVFSEARFPIVGDLAKIVDRLDELGEFDRHDPDELQWTWQSHVPLSKGAPRGDHLTLQTHDEVGRTILGSIEIGEDRLVLSTNSRERCDKGRDLLLARLDGLIGQPLTLHRTPEQLLEERSGSGPEPFELPPEVAEQALRSYLDHHYRQTLDEPLPYLGGKTPRQAASTKKGREQVISWLKSLENSEARRAAREGQRPYDFQWMWREMKIDQTG